MKHVLRMLAYRALMMYWAPKIDVYLVGFPKTGNTWFAMVLRWMLVKYCDLPEAELGNVLISDLRDWSFPNRLPPGMPNIHYTHNLPGFWADSKYKMKLFMSPFKGKKVILLIREPKDTLVSLYFHNVYRRLPPVFHGDITEMLHDERYGIESFIKYYKVWYERKNELGELLLVRYEDHRADPAGTVRKAAEFIGLGTLPQAIVEDIVSFSSFKNMKMMEKKKQVIARSSPPENENGLKVRKGIVGGFSEYLDEETIQYIDALVGSELPSFFGYSTFSTFG